MTDDLRTRIAAVIMDACHGVYLDETVTAADAVICELGLRQQRESGEIINTGGGAPIMYGRTRYVTEWENDE